MTRPTASKLSLVRRFRQVLGGLAALALLMALFFAVLRWRVNTPEEHLIFGRFDVDTAAGKNNE